MSLKSQIFLPFLSFPFYLLFNLNKNFFFHIFSFKKKRETHLSFYPCDSTIQKTKFRYHTEAYDNLVYPMLWLLRDLYVD